MKRGRRTHIMAHQLQHGNQLRTKSAAIASLGDASFGRNLQLRELLLAFPDQAKWSAAFKKWNEWKAEQPKPADQAVAGVVSAQAALLAEGMVKTMLLPKSFLKP